MPGSRLSMKSPFFLPWVIIAAVILIAQLVIFQAARRFASEASFEHASQLNDRRLFSQARIETQRAIDLYPYNGYALFRLGASDFGDISATDPRRGERALASLERAAPYMPHSPNLLRLLGQTQYRLQNYDRAAATLDKFFRLVPTPGTSPDLLHFVRAMAHFRTGRPGDAAVPLTLAAGYPQRRRATVVARILNSLALDQTRTAEAVFRASRHESQEQIPNDKQMSELLAAAERAGHRERLAQVLKEAATQPRQTPEPPEFSASAP